MIRLTIALCGAIFAVLSIWGEGPALTPRAQNPLLKSESSVLHLAAASKITPVRRISFTPEALPISAPSPDLWRVTASRVNVRATPSAKAEILGKVDRDEQVLLVADNGTGWVKIRIEGDGIEGWVSLNMLQKVE